MVSIDPRAKLPTGIRLAAQLVTVDKLKANLAERLGDH
jgi:hypothetical protein